MPGNGKEEKSKFKREKEWRRLGGNEDKKRSQKARGVEMAGNGRRMRELWKGKIRNAKN